MTDKDEEKKTAVALSYDVGDEAPKIADRIIDEAKKADVPFYKDSALAQTLSKLQIGEAIPPELYEVVAQILVFVDKMDKLRSKLRN